ncbi:MAG TPA: branched-chain amino acid ABC transporter permease [Desulfobacteraceae bacterium]|nr:AzlC family ABC transporter permease [Deltaproteobacteria bacterium]RLB97346.1 MAG: branched-chain amino acid ABC transporter permease [Deltaproteobacteria bacterium]HDI60599.1 branched-chain amino acid ABC transporter permease [Desulfobacteraceae bacterium]
MTTTRPTKLSEFLAGCRDEAPLQLGVAPFGMLYSIAALAVGMPAWLVQLSSALVFAGSAQLAIVQMLSVAAGALPIGLTAGLLNLRHVLYSASVAEYVRHLPRRWRLLLAYLLTDEAYAVAILRYQRQAAASPTDLKDAAPGQSMPDLRHWYFLGCGFTLWTCWQLSTAAGLVFGARIPPEWDIDFAVPLTFLALLTLLVRERASQAAALAAGVGVLAFAPLPYNLGIVAAILAGLLVGFGVAKCRGDRP